MRTLFHMWLSPPARKARVILKEKQLDFELKVERVWERREEFLELNPAGETPVLVEPDGAVIAGGDVIAEFLEEAYPERPLMSRNIYERAEVRRLCAWFDQKFNREVTSLLVEEKAIKRFIGQGQPNSNAIRAGLSNIRYHLEYIGYLTERRRYLAGDEFSLADISAATHLSALDYIDDVPWAEHEPAKLWYMRIKSRPSFRPLLADILPGITPPLHYAELDF